MTQTFTVDAKGNLLNSEMEVVGRLVSFEIDLTKTVHATSVDGRGAGFGKAVKDESTTSAQGQSNTRERTSNNVDVQRVWAHYQTVVPGGNRYVLEHKRELIIRNALKVRPLSRVLLAIDGLAASPFHNGQNESRKKYLGIQYALRGVGGEGNDERIDKMAELAGTANPLTHIPSAGHEMVRTRQRQVEAMLMHPGDANRRARGQSSEVYLREQFGLTATVEDDRVVWRRTGVSS